MADSWINYKIYNVKCSGNNDSIISLLVLRISHFRGRCKSVRRMEKTRSRRSEWAHWKREPLDSTPFPSISFASHKGWRFKRVSTKHNVQGRFKSLVCMVREHREVFLLLVFVLTSGFSTQKQQQSPQQLLNTQLTLQRRQEGSHLWWSPGHRHWSVHS